METALATQSEPQLSVVPADFTAADVQAALAGDLRKLSADGRLKMYGAICQTTGLNPLTKPFDWLELQGKLVLYANKGCAEQLRKIHKVTVEIIERRFEHGCHIVRVKATDGHGRSDEAIAAVAVNANAVGDVVANAMMKAETKAKRRVTLSICGLGMLDESELETIRGGKPAEAASNILSVETSADRAAEINGMQAEPIDVQSSPATTGQDTPPDTTSLPVVAEFISENAGTGKASAQADRPAMGTEPITPVNPTPAGRPEPPPAQAPAGSDFLNADGLLTDAGVAEVERKLSVRGDEDGKAAIAYLIHKGQLGKGKPLSSLSKTAAAYLLNNIVGFWKQVDGFKSAQAKGGAK